MNTLTTNKATPRPWKTHCRFIRGKDSIVADCQRSQNPDSDASLIVRAVNEYDALCAVAEAVKGIESMFDNDNALLAAYAEEIKLVHKSLSQLATLRKGETK